MKTGKLIGIIVVLAILLIVIAYFVGNSNMKKTVNAVATAPKPIPAVTGRTIYNSMS